jgi:L-arabinose isomerase-like protein
VDRGRVVFGPHPVFAEFRCGLGVEDDSALLVGLGVLLLQLAMFVEVDGAAFGDPGVVEVDFGPAQAAELAAAGAGGYGEPHQRTAVGVFGPGAMLEICPTIAANRPRVEIHPLGIGNREDPVRLVFDAAPGPATILGICDLGDRFRLVLNEVDVIPPDEPLPRLPVARAVWKPKPDLATSAEAWITAGGPHHTVLSTAVHRDQLVDFANVLGVELLVIDGSTNRRDLGDRVRWNQAYFRLAQGF